MREFCAHHKGRPSAVQNSDVNMDIAPQKLFLFFVGHYSGRYRPTSSPQVVGGPQVRERQRGDILGIRPQGYDSILLGGALFVASSSCGRARNPRVDARGRAQDDPSWPRADRGQPITFLFNCQRTRCVGTETRAQLAVMCSIDPSRNAKTFQQLFLATLLETALRELCQKLVYRPSGEMVENPWRNERGPRRAGPGCPDSPLPRPTRGRVLQVAARVGH